MGWNFSGGPRQNPAVMQWLRPQTVCNALLCTHSVTACHVTRRSGRERRIWGVGHSARAARAAAACAAAPCAAHCRRASAANLAEALALPDSASPGPTPRRRLLPRWRRPMAAWPTAARPGARSAAVTAERPVCDSSLHRSRPRFWGCARGASLGHRPVRYGARCRSVRGSAAAVGMGQGKHIDDPAARATRIVAGEGGADSARGCGSCGTPGAAALPLLRRRPQVRSFHIPRRTHHCPSGVSGQISDHELHVPIGVCVLQYVLVWHGRR
jgi:hypothetical protein